MIETAHTARHRAALARAHRERADAFARLFHGLMHPFAGAETDEDSRR